MMTDLKRLGDRNQREKEDTSGYLHHGGECSGNTTGNWLGTGSGGDQ